MTCVPLSPSSSDSLVVSSGIPLVPFCLPFAPPTPFCVSESVLRSPPSTTTAVAHTDGQQHRTSTSRAHSRRHVVIVSVFVQWCGADQHSEGNGEQQGRREVRQTHTQRAHHMRRGQQPGMHRTPHTTHTTHDTHSNPRQQAHTHTHSPAATPTHRWKREKQTGAAHKAPPHAHTARAVRRVGTPHEGYANTQEKVQLAHSNTKAK
ncbi:hypothetical protein ECC02_012460 [Trypanosoma cruzi]|uniref:Uncharacterized protein n=1 Tax=Trypanosoma cruzi TaxID=5693 RepID=A0A7J6XKY5_TRYCR|nr:hypothetical protein ECC02_012460 [Trypanosoma cruzi]